MRLDLQPDLKVCTNGPMGALLIGNVADRAGVPAPTIRYYESIGLLKPANRSASGYRRYSDATIEELLFIRKAQGLGFSLDEVAEILKLTRAGRTPCERVLSIAHQRVAALDERIRQLQRFRDHLAADLAKWDSERTAVSCRGLCKWIADAEPDSGANDVTVNLKPARKRGRTIGRR